MVKKQKPKSEEKSPVNYNLYKEKILKISFELDEKRHQMKMEELRFIRETDKIRHDNELERQRIKTAEIRRDREWRANKKYAEVYNGQG
jgi:hypothetical protein